MPDSLISTARDALAAAVALAEACHAQSHLDEPDDWDSLREEMRAAVRKIDAGAAILAAVLDAAGPATAKA